MSAEGKWGKGERGKGGNVDHVAVDLFFTFLWHGLACCVGLS